MGPESLRVRRPTGKQYRHGLYTTDIIDTTAVNKGGDGCVRVYAHMCTLLHCCLCQTVGERRLVCPVLSSAAGPVGEVATALQETCGECCPTRGSRETLSTPLTRPPPSHVPAARVSLAS